MKLKLIKKESEIIAAIDPAQNNETCELCDSALLGSLSVTSVIRDGIGVIKLSETAPRNWILCDLCNVLLCRPCAPHWKAGYCEDCVREYELKFDSEGYVTDEADETAVDKCRLCSNETDSDCGSVDAFCDACRETFDSSELCRSCYYKPYPLRLCAQCIAETNEI